MPGFSRVNALARDNHSRRALAGLRGELERVLVLPAESFPADVVHIGSVTACIERANHIIQPETTLRNPTAAPAKALVLTAPPQPVRNPSHLITLRG